MKKSITFYIDNTHDGIPGNTPFGTGHSFFQLQGPNLPAVESGATPSGFYGKYLANGNTPLGTAAIHDDGARYSADVNSDNPNVNFVASETIELTDCAA